ncbi:MAG: DNA internalization-related competence protein ComEC/Rec2 [Finegoldia magna]|nr:DNA internalization-related competence protein ComEC/Rec2 [Finegoldia magna]
MLITTIILIQIISATILYIYFNPIFIAIDVVVTGIVLFKDKKKLIISLLVLFLTIIHLNTIDAKYNSIKDNEFLDVNAVVINKNRSNKKYVVKLTNNNNIKFLVTTKKDLEIGDKVNIRSKVNKAYTNGNPYMFNYKNYLLKNNIYGDIYCRTNPEIIGKSKSPLLKIRKLVLNHIVFKLDSNFNGEESSVLKSVFTGSNFLSDDYTNAVNALGISHVFAISGLHIIILYTIFNKLFGIFKINRKPISWISLILIAIYGYAVGLPSSIVRAFIMLVIVELSNQMQIDWFDLNNLTIAAIIILLINPYNLLDVGFIFSFLATFTIIYLYPRFKKHNKKLYNYFLLSVMVYLVLLPIQLRFFNEYTLGFIIGNTIVLPIFTVVIQLTAIVLLIPNSINYIFVQLIKLCLRIISYIFATIDFLDIHSTNFMSFSILMIILYYIIIFTTYNRHYIKTLNDFNKKTLTNMLLLSLIIPLILNIINPITTLNFVDIGQGDCLLVRQYFKSFMIDTGGSYKSEDSSGEHLMEYLHKIGLNNLEYVFLTHFDEDHSKNLININKSYNPIVLSRFNGDKILKKKYNLGNVYVSLRNKQNIKIDNVDIKIIDKPISNEENDKSIVYKLYINNISLLITGDISSEYERNILKDNIKSDILKISHHGSKSSSDSNFLKKVRPKLAVISVGLRNEYGHPNNQTLDRLNKLNIPIKRTDLDGNIELVSSRVFNSIRANRDKYSVIHFLVGEQNSIITTIVILLYFKNRGVKNGFFIG